jgi:glycosyltransferase involved in cell wall biosynthesis
MSRSDTSSNPPFPAIAPVPEGVARPFWSVMMPTYNCSGHFEQVLRSVLEQDPGADRMQITVVDDCSTNGKAEEVVNRLAPGRVEFYRQPANVGLALNWNTCVARSRGSWVHLLHQDDLLLPGFYEAMGRAALGHPGLGAAFCRCAYIDDAGVRTSVSEPERSTAGILEGWLETIATGQRIECPTIVVRRAAYEQLGGFSPELCFALDWEMWVRIAAHYPVWYEPEVLACYRRHRANETANLERAGADLPDVVAALDGVSRHVPPQRRGELRREAERRMRWRWHREANRLIAAGRWWQALAQIRRAYRLESLPTRSAALLGYSKWAIKSRFLGLVPRALRDDAAPK